MVRAIGFILSLIAFHSLSQAAKDTVREEIDYSQSKRTFASDENQDRINKHYLGVQANQLLRQLLNLSGNNGSVTNPFLLIYSFNNSQTGKGMSVGFGINNQKFTDQDQGTTRETTNRDLAVRMGYERKAELSKRWVVGGGFDAFINNLKRDTQSTQGSFTTDFKSKSTGFGIGIRGSLLFKINGPVYLGTETTLYFQSTKTKTELNTGGGAGTTFADFKENSFSLQVPVAIFIVLKF